MSAETGVVLLWLIPLAAALIIAWVRGRRADKHADRADNAGKRADYAMADLRRVTRQRDQLAVQADSLRRRVSMLEHGLAVADAVIVTQMRRVAELRAELEQRTAAGPSELDRAREKRDARGRYAKVVAE